MSSFTIEAKGKKYENETDVKEYTDKISKLEDLEKVQFSGNSYGIEACRALATSLKDKKHLKSVICSDMFTGRLRSELPQSVGFFADALLDKQELKLIDFSDNAFGPDGIIPLCPLISKNTSIATVKVNNTGLGPQGGKHLAKALLEAQKKNETDGKQSQLRVFVCGRSRLENGSMQDFAQAFQNHALLTEVIMPQDGIRPEGMVSLLQGLKHCKNLQVLDVQDNTFTAKAASQLADSLPAWSQLRVLNVGDCMLTAKGSLEVLNSLKSLKLSELEVLNLQYNEMNEKGALLLASFLSNFPSLKQLELNGNCFEEDSAGADAIRNALESQEKEDVLGSLSDMEEEEDDEEDEEEEETEKEEKEKSQMDQLVEGLTGAAL